MSRWQFALCFALLAVSAQAQDLGDLEGLLGDLNLNDLINAGAKCNSDKLTAAADACSSAIEASKTPCPPACASLYKEFDAACGDLFKSLGLDTVLGLCGETVPTSTTSPTPPVDEPAMAGAPGAGDGDYADYAGQPPMPNVDYSQGDYAGAPAEGPATVMPISALSPTTAPVMPSPEPSPSPAIDIPAITGLPASCDSYFQAIQNQSLNDQVACGEALANNPSECPDVCKAIYSVRPDDACMKALQDMAANSPPLPAGSVDTSNMARNPCIAALSGAGSRSSVTGVFVAAVGAVAALMVL